MVTLASADKALKSLYLDVVAEQLNTEINPFLAKIKQTTSDVWGKEVRKVAQYGINGGIGAGTEDGNLPTSSGNNYEQMVLTLKNLYGTIEISDKAIRASANDAGAFVNLLNAEMEGLVKSSALNMGRMLFGDGNGILTKVKGINDGEIQVLDTKNILPGMMVCFHSGSNGLALSVTKRKVLNVNRDDKTITLDGAALTTTDLPVGTFIVVQGSFQQEITGLGAIFKSTGSIYGLTEAFDGLVVGCDAKGNDAAKAVLHLFLGQFMTGMAGQAGIGNEGDVLPLFQPFGDFLRRCVDAFHPQGEGHGTAENLPGIEGADDRADVDLGFIADPVHRCQIIGNDGPALGIAMAVDIFRQRFDDEIGSQVQWSLVERRCKGIVDGQDSPVFMSDFGDGFDI